MTISSDKWPDPWLDRPPRPRAPRDTRRTPHDADTSQGAHGDMTGTYRKDTAMAQETRDEFRERIGKFAADWDGGDWELMHPEDRELYASQAEAVYAECLRNLAQQAATAHFTEAEIVRRFILRFAGERGIDLEGTR